MHRIIQYFNQYKILDKAAQDFLIRHGQLHTYKKGSYYITRHEKKYDWCFLLEGLVGYEVSTDRGQVLERLCPIHHYFSGTKHPYSHGSKNAALIFLQPSIVYSISNNSFKLGIKQHHELNTVFHILKQHEINLTAIFLRLPKIARETRLTYLYQAFPEIEGQLTIKQLCSLLGYTDNRQYYKALDYYFDNKL